MTPTRVPKQLASRHARRAGADPEAGQVVSEYLMWAAVVVGVIVILGAALQAFGVDVIEGLRGPLGL